MKVSVKYFASIREAIGVASQQHDSQATTLGELRDELIAIGGSYAHSLARGRAVRMAQNQVMCDESATLTPDAEVAFFPPLTGG